MRKSRNKSGRKLVWRVRVTMAERGVRTVTQLAGMLKEGGVNISVSQLGRLIDGKTQLINVEIVEGLMAALDCDLDEILTSSESKIVRSLSIKTPCPHVPA